MPIIETKFGIICILTNLWWNIVMDDWNLDEKSLSTWQYLQHCNAQIVLQEMTNTVRLTFSVGDTTQ